MPIYEYACGKCDHEFEVEQRITDDPVKTCPACRSRKVKKLISMTSFVLKGGGWYSDLYASPGAKKDDAKDKKDTGDAKPDAPEKKADRPEKTEKTEKTDKTEKKSGGADKGGKPKSGKKAAAA